MEFSCGTNYAGFGSDGMCVYMCVYVYVSVCVYVRVCVCVCVCVCILVCLYVLVCNHTYICLFAYQINLFAIYLLHLSLCKKSWKVK